MSTCMMDDKLLCAVSKLAAGQMRSLDVSNRLNVGAGKHTPRLCWFAHARTERVDGHVSFDALLRVVRENGAALRALCALGEFCLSLS